MEITCLPVSKETLGEYSTVPMIGDSASLLVPEIQENGFGGITLREEAASPHWYMDFDTAEGEGPERWLKTFDTAHWALFLARQEGKPVGGITLAFRTPEVFMLGGRNDITVLWDIRVHPDWKRQGIGSGLFAKAAEWARERGCDSLKVETQNVNVPACRFYMKQGCLLGEINRFAYTAPELRNQVMLVWYLAL